MQQKEATFITVLALIGVLTAMPLALGGGLYIPFFVLFVITAYLMVFHWRQLSNRDLIFLSCCFGLLVVNLLFSGIDGFIDQMKALLQLMAAFCLAVFVPKIFSALGRKRLHAILVWAVSIVVMLTIFERLGVTKEISDSWRQFAFQGTGFTDPYASDARDLAMVGYIRPKVFAPEPAFLAGFLFLCFACLSLITRDARTTVFVLGANVLCWFLIGSPVLLLSLAAVTLTLLYRFRSQLIYALPVLLLGALILLIRPPEAVSSGLNSIEARFSWIVSGDERFLKDDSVRSRVYVPFAIGVPAALDHNAFWGVGIGGKERLSQMVDPNYSHYSTGIGSTENTLGTNSLGSMLATLGIIGTVILIALVIWYWSPVGAAPLLLGLLSVFLFLFTQGAYETQSFWFGVFLIVGAAGIYKTESLSMQASEVTDTTK